MTPFTTLDQDLFMVGVLGAMMLAYFAGRADSVVISLLTLFASFFLASGYFSVFLLGAS